MVGETVTAAVGCVVFVGKGVGVSGTAVASSVGAGDVGVRVGSMVGWAESAGEDTHELPQKTSTPNNRATIIFRCAVREQKQLKVGLKVFSLVISMTRLQTLVELKLSDLPAAAQVLF
jgi:hypothetical protein